MKICMPLRFLLVSVLILNVLLLDSFGSPIIKSELTKRQAFEMIFGSAASMDPDMVSRIKSAPPGERHYEGFDDNGKPGEVWFIDTDPSHQEDKRPVLVRAIDEDGDLFLGEEADFDSDLYIVDWNADGSVDVVLDFEDIDGDQDLDRMGIYWYSKIRMGEDEKYSLRVWWSRDDGDDNMLWHHVNYNYDQLLCQYKTHFGGDETFCSFYYEPDKSSWIPYYENPFLFFDINKDGLTEEVLRVSGTGDLIQSLRWSFDVDNDATESQPRDYDVGITAIGPGWSPSDHRYSHHIEGNVMDSVLIRGIPGGPILKRTLASRYLSQVRWSRVLFTWDETDLNRAWYSADDTIERWEGIIAPPSLDTAFYMPQIGAPSCSPYNKRFELVLNPSGPNEYYFNPADHRVHIRNCDKAWIKADYNFDGRVDMNYNWIDSNKDGILDRIELDVDNDGDTDDSWELTVSEISPVSWDFEELNSTYVPVLVLEPAKKYALSKILASVIEAAREGVVRDSVMELLQKNMQGDSISREVACELINSDESLLFYIGLACDRQIVKIKQQGMGGPAFWKDFYMARGIGNTELMSSLLCEEFKLDFPIEDYQTWLVDRRNKGIYPKVAWNDHLNAQNWYWESELAAFRFYKGHIDIFGKRSPQLIFPNFEEITKESYHLDRNEWGMDILEIGRTSGCGGLILYVDGVAYPVRAEVDQDSPIFIGRLLEENPDTVTIEIEASAIVPGKAYKVKIRPSAIADHEDASVEIIVEGGSPGETIELGIGMTRLPEESFIFDQAKGVLGTWGFQNPEIGWIGMGIVFPSDRFIRMDEQAGEHRVVLQCEIGKPLSYRIQGRWLKGLRFSSSPSAQDWVDSLKLTAFEK